MHRDRRERARRRLLCAVIFACPPGVAVWASVADGKVGWTVVSAAVPAGIAPSPPIGPRESLARLLRKQRRAGNRRGARNHP